MPLYFAYGSNMDRAAMAERCPRSRPLGLARLMAHRLVILQEGYVSAERGQGAVHGLLYDLALSDVAALDRYEAVGQGLYRKSLQAVVRQPGGPARALVYLGRSAGGGQPRPGYMAGVVAAAREIGLPESYVAGLARLGGLEAVAPAGKSRLPGLLPPDRGLLVRP